MSEILSIFPTASPVYSVVRQGSQKKEIEEIESIISEGMIENTWKSKPLKNTKLPKYGSYINGVFYEVFLEIKDKSVYPDTIQRFKSTHSLPTPTATDYILRKPTNTIKSRAFRPGVNKSVNLNRWIEMFPTRDTELPDLDEEGYLINKDIKGIVPNPQWVEWVMGFPIDWTEY